MFYNLQLDCLFLRYITAWGRFYVPFKVTQYTSYTSTWWKSSLGFYPWVFIPGFLSLGFYPWVFIPGFYSWISNPLISNPCVFIPAFPNPFVFESLHFHSVRFSIPVFCKIREITYKKSSNSQYFSVQFHHTNHYIFWPLLSYLGIRRFRDNEM